MLARSPKQTARKPEARSRVSNGKSMGTGDMRTVWNRRLRDLIELYSLDVNPDVDAIPEATKALIRRSAVLTVELERAEAGFAKNGAATNEELASYQTTANSLRRFIETLRLKHSIKDAAEVAKTIESEEVHKRVIAGFTAKDWGVVMGSEKANRQIARAIAFMADKAVRTGEPIPEAIAEFMVSAGFVRFADNDIEPVEEKTDDSSLL